MMKTIEFIMVTTTEIVAVLYQCHMGTLRSRGRGFGFASSLKSLDIWNKCMTDGPFFTPI